MTDKELLELAAKAAGIECWRTFIDEKWGSGFLMAGKLWNPLTDDGDALRLAVKLNLIVGAYGSYVSVCRTFAPKVNYQDEITVWHSEVNNDPYAATRRAIVRAAAEIGKAST
jgi:hypothetical protein